MRSNFYLSFWVLSRLQRDAITTVYRWCRLVDDVVDQPQASVPGTPYPDTPGAQLAWWRREVTQTFQGRPTHPVTVKLLPVIEHYHLPETYFQAVLDGVSMDLERQRYATFEELYPYCYGVAGVVGLMCLAVFTGGANGQAPDQPLRDYAVNLGIAFQLTNILRDVKTDAARGRLYLPQEDLARYGCPEQDLLAGRCTAAVRQTLEATISRARRCYAQAEALLRPQDVRTLIAAELMASVYRRLLEKIAQDPCRIWRERVRVPIVARCWIVGTTWGRLMWRSRTLHP